MTPLSAFLLGYVVGSFVTATVVAVVYAAFICSIKTPEES